MSLDRHFRKTIAHPEGALAHDGDCHIYSFATVCTCGLLHELMWLGATEAIERYPAYKEQYLKHKLGLNLLQEIGMSEEKKAKAKEVFDWPPAPLTSEEEKQFKEDLVKAGFKIKEEA